MYDEKYEIDSIVFYSFVNTRNSCIERKYVSLLLISQSVVGSEELLASSTEIGSYALFLQSHKHSDLLVTIAF